MSNRRIQAPPVSAELPKKVVRLSTLAHARDFLRIRGQTTQAGFTSERIPAWLFSHRPILFDDGASHDDHRKTLARFFAPKVLATKHQRFIEECAQERITAEAAPGPSSSLEILVDALALHFTVQVTSQIVGLTHSRVEKLAKRLTDFFRQPPVDHTRPDHGRTNAQWAQAARKALGPVISLYVADVRPAIAAHRKQPQDDVISYLLDRGYSNTEILMECLTYGTAGMVTTREFICIALWHLLDNPQLAARYQIASGAERNAILNEIIRLEPPVGHIYRRVRGEQCPYPAGTLVDVDVRSANVDPQAFGDDATSLCTERGLPPAQQAGLSFGDGDHRCPGQPLALLETDILLRAILAREPRIVIQPRIEWDTLIEGYQIRDFRISLTDASPSRANFGVL